MFAIRDMRSSEARGRSTRFFHDGIFKGAGELSRDFGVLEVSLNRPASPSALNWVLPYIVRSRTASAFVRGWGTIAITRRRLGPPPGSPAARDSAGCGSLSQPQKVKKEAKYGAQNARVIPTHG